MPAIIGGPIQINIVSGNGIVEFGDSLFVSPKIASKTPAGSGGFNTGIYNITNNGISGTNYIDPDAIDQPMCGNN
ncbi:spore germination protein [Neobacillus sp. SM06]|uniref:spore germination protein n=1 Tax=Neobacillus sp. SM06 TaxID=3422492 RepID=UPI003D2D142D